MISGPTTHPKNNLTYLKVHGSIKSVQGSGLPPFEAEIIDGGGWTQEDHSPSGEPWARADLSALLRCHLLVLCHIFGTRWRFCFCAQSYWTIRWFSKPRNGDRGRPIWCLIVGKSLNVLLNSWSVWNGLAWVLSPMCKTWWRRLVNGKRQW